MTLCTSSAQKIIDDRFVLHTIDLKTQSLKFYLQNKNGINLGNFKTLRDALLQKNEELVFAMNGGMYLKNGSAQGLYIENGITKKRLNTTKKAYGNFYLQPNGIFYLTKDNRGVVCKTNDFRPNKNIYTQHNLDQCWLLQVRFIQFLLRVLQICI
jgi:uncharacterized protein YigE (DUF2233 family)